MSSATLIPAARRAWSQNLDTVFTNATFANALTAIVASLAGDVLVRTYGTPVAPFNAVSVVLALAAVLIARNWRENYGNRRVARPLPPRSARICLRRAPSHLLATSTRDRKQQKMSRRNRPD